MNSLLVFVIFVLIEICFFLGVREIAIFEQAPRLRTLVVLCMELAKGESEVVGSFPPFLLVIPSEELGLVLQILLHIMITVLVIMEISAVLLEGTVLTLFSFYALHDLMHNRAFSCISG